MSASSLICSSPSETRALRPFLRPLAPRFASTLLSSCTRLSPAYGGKTSTMHSSMPAYVPGSTPRSLAKVSRQACTPGFWTRHKLRLPPMAMVFAPTTEIFSRVGRLASWTDPNGPCARYAALRAAAGWSDCWFPRRNRSVPPGRSASRGSVAGNSGADDPAADNQHIQRPDGHLPERVGVSLEQVDRFHRFTVSNRQIAQRTAWYTRQYTTQQHPGDHVPHEVIVHADQGRTNNRPTNGVEPARRG